MLEYVESGEFDALLMHWVRLEVERERQDKMIERYRSLTGAWAADRRSATVTG